MKRSFLLVPTLAALTACATVGPDFARPEVATPDAYAGAESAGLLVATDDGSRQADWWRALAAPKLDVLIDQAIAQSPTVAEADATLAAAQAAADYAYGGALPDVDARANAERSRINPASFGFSGFPATTISRYTIGAGISYDLDLFGRERRTREAADARAQAETYHAEAARLTLAGQIALQAGEIATLREQIETIESIVASDRETLDLVQGETSAGAAARVDYVRAATQLAQDEASLPNTRQRLATARTSLAILTGHTPGAWTAPDFALEDFVVPSAVPVAVPSELVRGRPDILAAEAALHEAMAEIGVSEAQLYPDVSLTGDFALVSLDPNELFEYESSAWTIGPSVHLPLFGRDASRARVHAAEAEAQAADARYRATVLRAFGEVADSLHGLANIDEEVRLQGDAVELARENLTLARRAYQLGGGSLTDVIDAQRQLSIAQRLEAEARGRRIQAVMALYAATATTSLPAAELALVSD